jgi:hypothetical protein
MKSIFKINNFNYLKINKILFDSDESINSFHKKNKKTPTKVEVKNVGAKGFEPLTPWV